VPNLGALREYKPLLRQFWADGLFAPQDERYFRLIDRSHDMRDVVEPEAMEPERVFATFRALFNRRGEIEQQSYFDRMTHFELNGLLPALLQVEDRVSMAHSLESRLPLLDHPIVEYVATVPAGIKFKGAVMKLLLKSAFADDLPKDVARRRDKMGFPVPLKEWFEGPLREFVCDIFATGRGRSRAPLLSSAFEIPAAGTGRFSRRLWVLLSLELWHQRFHDRAAEFRGMLA
jgi:asparagine synthase (glutamine-hydrolysing)